MKYSKYFLYSGLLAASLHAYGQTNRNLPTSLKQEEAIFKDAVRRAHQNYEQTEYLEQFITRYPGSKYAAKALLELERAQLLDNGTYDFPYAEPRFAQLKPTEQPYQFFYENQKDLASGYPDYLTLRKKYEQLLAMEDPDYANEAKYYLGYLDYVEGHYDSALSRFASLPNEEKYANTVPFYKMQILYAKGDWPQALDIINSQQMTNADLNSEQKAEVHRIKAECLAQMDEKKEALAFFRMYLNECEDPVRTSAYNCAVLAYDEGDNDLALKALRKAVGSGVDSVRQYSYMLMGQIYLIKNEVPEAKMAFEQASKIPADMQAAEDAAYNTAVLVHETSYSPWGDEIELFENFLNNYPNSKYSDNISSYLSEVYMTTKNYDAALSSIRKINKPNQSILDAKQILLYQLGIQDFVNGKYRDANNHFTECISVKGNNDDVKTQAYFWRGESRYHLDFLTDAAEDYLAFNKSSSKVSDKNLLPMGHYSLGYVYYKKQDFVSSSRSFEKFTSYPEVYGTENYYDALARLGDCAYYSRNFSAAENYYATVADANSNSTAYSMFQQAFMLGLQKKYAQKQNVLDRLISAYSKTDYADDAWLEKGNTSLLQGDNNAAINSFKHIVDNYPDAPTAPQAAVQLAMTYNNNGQVAQAQKIYEMVAQKYPNTEEAMTAMQDLKTISITSLYNEMPIALSAGEYEHVIENYNALANENIDFRDLQRMQLMVAKAYLGQGVKSNAIDMLKECAKDIRTESGAEAKYTLAQMYFEDGLINESTELVTSIIQEGTPHQYWLARTIILMSDITAANDDAFTATEYLKSLKSNYKTKDDIQTMIENRLAKLK